MTITLPLAQWLSAQRPDDAPVAWLGDHTWTVGQMRHDVAQLAGQLLAQPGERWALCFEDSYLFIVALLGALHAGKTPVIPGHSRLSLLEEQRTLFHGVLSDRTLGWNGPLYVVASAKRAARETIALPAVDPASVVEIFTSGSTGTPRRVIKPIASLDREAALLAERFGERLAGCRIVASVVPQHLYGLTFRIFLPMALGLPLHAAMTYYAEQLSALPATHRYGFISSPAFLKRLDHDLTPPPIALIVSAGGMLPWGDVVQTQAWANVTPDEIYGSTETGILAWRYRAEDDTPWLPFAGMRFVQENDAWRVFSPLIPDPAGLLLDDNLAFEDNGLFRLHGRRGRVVKIEEKRISLCEVEQRVLALDGIVEAAALPITRNGRQGIGVLVVVDAATRARMASAAGRQQELTWRKALIPWLEPVAIPRYWRVIEAIPVNSMNKRVYAQLQEFFHDPA